MNKTKLWVGLGATVFIVIGVLGSGILGRPSDKELIQTALKESIEASREGRPGGVLEYLSANFTVNSEQYGTRDIAKTIREMKPHVELERDEPSISGDSATITSPVKLSLSLPPVSYTVGQVTMSFSRETARKWLIFPTTRWRLKGVDVPEQVVEDVRQQFGNGSQL